ncbi:MAG: hypothetical protein ABI671_10530 [Burkholderiales bacterium]
MLHLHRFENQQRLPCLHRLARHHHHVDNGAGHRRVDLVVLLHSRFLRCCANCSFACRRGVDTCASPPAAAATARYRRGFELCEHSHEATAYPGTLRLQIDATDLDHKIFRVKEGLPAQAGPLTLLYPRWLPGEHAPNGPIGRFAGLRISAAGQTLAWRRDPLNVYAFHLDVPPNVARIELEFQFLSPMGRGEERVVMTREMLGLQWRSSSKPSTSTSSSTRRCSPAAT